MQPEMSPPMPMSPLSTQSNSQLIQNDEEDPEGDQPSISKSLNSTVAKPEHMITLVPRSVTLSDLLSVKQTEGGTENCPLPPPPPPATATQNSSPMDPMKALFGDQLSILSRSGSS